MILRRFADWLGLGRSTLVAGLHLSAEHLSLVAVRDNPLRLVSVGREFVFDAAMVNDEPRLIASLAQDLAGLANRMGLAPGTNVVAAIEPRQPSLSLTDPHAAVEHHCEVKARSHDRLIDVVTQAGLQLIRLDPVPLALLRAVGGGGRTTLAVRSTNRWSVVAGPLLVEAERSNSPAVPGLSAGTDLGSLQRIEQLPSLAVPRRLQETVDLDRDAVAIGAALAGLGLAPQASVRPVDDATQTTWAVERVEARSRPDHPQPPTPTPIGEERTS